MPRAWTTAWNAGRPPACGAAYGPSSWRSPASSAGHSSPVRSPGTRAAWPSRSAPSPGPAGPPASSTANRSATPGTRTLLSIAAWRLAPLPESRAALLDALAEPERDVFTDPGQTDDTQDFLTDSGRTLLSVADGRWTAWDVATHRRTGSGRLGDGSGDHHAVSQVLNGPDPTTQPRQPTQSRALADDRPLFDTAAADAVIPSADARVAAVCTQDRPLVLRDLVRHRTVPGGWQDSSAVDCSSASLAFDRNGTRFAAVSATRIRVWDTASGRQLADIAQPGAAHLALTPDGRFLAAAAQDATTVWRLSAPEAPVLRHPLADGPVTGLAWDPDTPTLRYLTGGTVHSLDLSVSLTSQWLDRPLEHELLSPDGRLLATAERHGDRYRFRLRDTGTGRIVARPPALPLLAAPGRTPAGDAVPLMTFSPDSAAFAYGIAAPEASAARFVVWDVPGHRTRASLHPRGPSAVRSIALTPGGRKLLLSRATSDGSLTGEVWNTVRGTRTDRPDALATTLKSVLASGFAGPATALPFGWDTGVPLARGDDADVVALSPDGVHLATGGAFGSVTVWRGRTERRREAVIPAAVGALGARVTALAFSPDGRTLAVGYGSGDLRLWDVAGRQPLGGALDTPGDAIRSVAFGPDGRSVHASSRHVPVQRYAIDPASIVTRLCARTGTTLTVSEWRTYLPDVPYRRLCDLPGTVDSGPEAGKDATPAPSCTAASTHTSEKSGRRVHESEKSGGRVHEPEKSGGRVTDTSSPGTSSPEAHPSATEDRSSEARKGDRSTGRKGHGRHQQ